MAAANWANFSIQLPGKDFLEPVRNILETVVVFLEVLKTVLDTIKTFLIQIPNPVAALVQALIDLVHTLFQSLNRTGIYAYFDIPDPSTDPNFYRYVGGYQAFVERFKGSLLDTRDPNRPQPIAGATQSGFALIVADAESPVALMHLVKILVHFFQKDEFLSQIRFPTPNNVRLLALGDKNEPLSTVAKVFGATPKGVCLQWTPGGVTNPPDPGFNDLGSIVANEFIPPKWLIERSSSPLNVEVDVGLEGVGRVTYMLETPQEDRGVPGAFISQKVSLADENGDPVIKFDTYKVFTLTDDNGAIRDIVNGVFGELGITQYFDMQVELDHTYYYRVRAFLGGLDLDGTVLQWATEPSFGHDPRKPFLPWPGQGLVMGRPSPIFRIRVPKVPPDFDVLTTLRQLFLSAFSLNFHLPINTNTSTLGGNVPDQFTPSGVNVTPTPVTHIGYGSLTRQAGALSAFSAEPTVSAAAKGLMVQDFRAASTVTQPPVSPVTGAQVPVPWQRSIVRRQAGRLAHLVGASLLEQGFGAIEEFQKVMQGPFPRGLLNSKTPKLASATTLADLVRNLTYLDASGNYDSATYNAYVEAFGSASCRLNLLFAIQSVTPYTLGGTPPDWIQVSILKDIIPWSGQLLYDILAKIRAMSDAFRGISAEIKQFIDLIERKITVLEQFIKYLLSILDFILSLQGGFYALYIPNTGGDISALFQLIGGAGGTPPPSGPGGYSAGVAFAYVGTDVTAFTTAFKLIF